MCIVSAQSGQNFNGFCGVVTCCYFLIELVVDFYFTINEKQIKFTYEPNKGEKL